MTLLARLRTRLAARFWSRTFNAGGIATWMSEPVVRSYINESVTGATGLWPMEWLAAEWVREPFPRAISLGCGDGPLERDLVRKGLCAAVLGLDISSDALALARTRADSEGLGGIEYRHADLNTVELEPESFDAAFFHQSLHHVARLEHCLDQVARALVPGGFLYLDEYVGPARSEWRREHLAEAQEAFSALPKAVRRVGRLRLPVDWRDPSEAVRSSGILRAVSDRFDIVRRRDYGGNLLALIYPSLRLAGMPDGDRNALLERLIVAERVLLARGAASYCTVAIARRRDSR